MKKFLILFLVMLIQMELWAQPAAFKGDWQGKLAGTELRLIFHISATDSGFTATIDSPDQGSKGIKCDEVVIVKDTITIRLKAAAVQYKGVLAENKESIIGSWKQGMASTGLHLTKGVTAVVRPQTPQPPFPYFTEDVSYANKNKSVTFGATFTRPQKEGRYPTVIIISGSGTQDRNGTMFEHQPYAVLADHLTRNGIAVLRVDDRGAGNTTLGPNPTTLTSADFAEDVEAGIAYLQSRSDVDKANIGLIGHSEGGMIAPLVASRNASVAFIVLLAGPGLKGADIWQYQMRRAFVQPGLPAQEQHLAYALPDEMNQAYTKGKDVKTIQQAMTDTYKSWKAGVPDSLEKKLFKAPVGMAYYQMLNNLKEGLSWLQYFLNYDPAPVLQKVKQPVLAINGEHDFQILATENLSAIEAALKKGGHKKYTVKSFPQLNHLFQTSPDREQSYGALEESFAPAAMEFIVSWIKRKVK